ncbi:MAG: hypothetical protein KGL95_03460, partial [Patescibacteria group bacterium]|nr:hypothetical protein [Patescibacteria group bacterium]
SNSFAIIIAIIIVLLWVIHTPHHQYLEQDNYWEYGQALLRNRPFIPTDTRLFPATGILFALISIIIHDKFIAGMSVSIVFFITSYILIKKLNPKVLPVFILCFPPIVFKSFSLISSESFMIVLLLSSFLLWENNKKNWSYAVLGLLLWVRLIAVAIIAVRLFFDVQEKNFPQFLKGLCIIGISGLLFIFYNQLIFHKPFIQFITYPQAGHASIALIQFVEDLFRSFAWGQYRIFLSGLAYFLLTILYFILVWRKRNKNNFNRFAFLSAVTMTIFTFTIGPTPFLEEYARFLVPVFLALGFLLPQIPKKTIPIFVIVSSILVLL